MQKIKKLERYKPFQDRPTDRPANGQAGSKGSYASKEKYAFLLRSATLISNEAVVTRQVEVLGVDEIVVLKGLLLRHSLKAHAELRVLTHGTPWISGCQHLIICFT